MLFKPRDYQLDISNKAYKILNTLKIVALIMEVRCGKTITAFLTADKAKCKNLLFITKKKVIDSKTILNDYNLVKPNFTLTQINYESVHKINANDFDMVIVDESHSLGAFPKPSKRTKQIKEIVGNKRVILLSGTITPESYSQIYHQFWISNYSPFEESNFYKWAKNYVNVTQRRFSQGVVNDYSKANQNLINQKISKYILTFTQAQAGFTSTVKETVLTVKMKPTTYLLVNKLEKDKVFEGKKGGIILGDTGVKLMSKVHQLYSGTIKLEDGSSTIIDDTKAKFIRQRFRYNKIAIYYKFKEELELLKEVFKDELTTDLAEFNNTSKDIALQFLSAREGISLKKADYIVAMNIDFSSTTYFQFRDRMTTKERLRNELFWVFAENGIEEQIYKTVLDKKSYTLNYYKQWKANTKEKLLAS